MNGLALCSGIAGLDIGLRVALGEGYRTICHVERDAYAASVLMARMEDSSLECAPIWDDLTTFDALRWRGAVDIVTAGFPCQPWSVAGKKRGVDDERWLWPDIVRIFRDCEPTLVFLENVPGLIRKGLAPVLQDLDSLGFNAEWTSLRASDVGAPHRRERVFILAYRDGAGQRASGGRLRHEWDDVGGSGQGMGGPGSSRRRPDAFGRRRASEGQDREGQATGGSCESGPPMEPTGRARLEGAREERRAPRSGARGFPPGPSDMESWRRWIAAGGPEPAIRRGPDGIPSRMERLRCLGNAVVPTQVALAFHILSERLR